MSRIEFKTILHSKKFWTLVASIIAALTAFFVSSCAASYKTRQSFIKYEGPDSTTYTIIFDQSGYTKSSKNGR